jgi:uncharacterized protein (TIGR02270 family)
VLALESGEPRKWREVLAVGTSSAEAARGLVSALGWLPFQDGAKPIAELLASSAPAQRRVGIAAAAAHGLAIEPEIEAALDDCDPRLRARALRAAGQLGFHRLRSAVAAGLTDRDATARFWAAWAVARLGGEEAIPVLQAIAVADASYRNQAVEVALRAMALPAANTWRRKLARTPRLRRLSVMGAGVIGDPRAVPWLIDQMGHPDLARISGEAFSAITGVDLALQDLEGEQPDGFTAGPNEDPQDDNVALDTDANLPWPDPDRVARWWHAHRARFITGRRHLLGKPIARESLEVALRAGFQRQRAAAALELALLDPSQPLFDVRAPGRRQQALLGLGRRA